MIIGFGSYLILSTRLRKLNFEKRMTSLPKFKTSYITSFVFGAAFAAGWTPCVGPILGSTLTLARHCTWRCIQLITGIFVRIGSTIPHNRSVLLTGNWNNKKDGEASKVFNLAIGGMLIILGILVFTNNLSLLGNFPLANQIINLERGI